LLINHIIKNNINLGLEILEYEYNKNRDILNIKIKNNFMLPYYKLLPNIYLTLVTFEVFNSFSENKVFISNGQSIHGNYFMLHNNFLINKDTTLLQFYEDFTPNYNHLSLTNYAINDILIVLIKCFNLDDIKNKNIKINSKPSTIRNYSTKISNSLNYITPLKSKLNINLSTILSMDIETIHLNDDIQIPILITAAYYDKYNNIKCIHTLINYDYLNEDLNLSIKDLWERFFYNLFLNLKTDGLKINKNKYIIFMHNLGSFDGDFLYKGLMLLDNIFNYKKINTIMDKQNEFIEIQAIGNDFHFIWKDSCRIFNVSLEELSKIFNVQGKINPYKQEYNNISIFNNSELLNNFINYGMQDSITLLQAMNNAQNTYLNKYNIDIANKWSTSSISMEIFRTLYLNENIPILNKSTDSFIRNSYFGGATDYYQMYGENMKHYDVNSLYPYAMLNPMPFEVMKYYSNIPSELDLLRDDLFGFFEVEVKAPSHIKYPILPYRNNKTYNGIIFPLGTWKGVYFSEILKKAIINGYEIKLLSGYIFTKKYLFNDYVNDFYTIKQNSSGAERFIAKMHLNQLYGYFGRSLELIHTSNFTLDELKEHLGTRLINNIIQVTDDKFLTLFQTNLNNRIIKQLNIKIDMDIKNITKKIKSNVAIASAITSYAQIKMIDYKNICQNLGINIYYTDTDSLFTDKALPNYLIGSEIGQLKDELNGGIITKAYFLGIKKYGYEYLDNNDKLKFKSVFSGVERNSLNLDELIKLSNGYIIEKIISKPRFYRNFKNLTMKIKNNATINISKDKDKTLINNSYNPQYLLFKNKPILLSNNNILTIYLIKIKNALNKYKKILKK
jgi:hypothetical protein